MALVLTPEGYVSFSIKGAQTSSKKKSALLTLSKSEYLLRVSKGNKLTLQEASLLGKPPFSEDLAYLAFINLASEALSKSEGALDGKETYSLLDNLMKAIDADYPPLSASAFLMYKLAILLGVAPDTAKCVACGKKEDIVAFSLDEGGYLCRDDADRLGILHSGKEMLNEVRYLALAPYSDIGRVSIGEQDALFLTMKMGQFIRDRAGIWLRSLSLFETL